MATTFNRNGEIARQELIPIKKYLEDEYCFELAKKIYNIYMSIVRCKVELGRINANEILRRELEQDMNLLNEITNRLNGKESFTCRYDFISVNDTTLMKFKDIIKSIITNEPTYEVFINIDLLKNRKSELQAKIKELQNITVVDRINEANTIKEAFEKAVIQSFSSKTVENVKLKNLDKLLDLDDNELSKRVYKVNGMRTVNKEVALRNGSGSIMSEKLNLVVAKNLRSSGDEVTCFASDMMSIKACFNSSILYIYFNLQDILHNRIDWKNVPSEYHLSPNDILDIEFSQDNLLRAVGKMLIVLTIFNSSTETHNPVVSQNFKDCCNWKREINFEELKRLSDIWDNHVSVYEGSTAEDMVDYYRTLYKCATSICDHMGITTYKQLNISMRESANNNKRISDRATINIDDYDRLMARLCQNGDPRVNRIIEKMKTNYVPRNISYYNIIPHVFIHFDGDKALFIPVGDLKRYKLSDSSVDDTDISMASFMFKSNSSDKRTDGYVAEKRVYFYQNLDNLSAELNAQSILDLKDELAKLNKDDLVEVLSYKDTFGTNKDWNTKNLNKLSEKSSILISYFSEENLVKIRNEVRRLDYNINELPLDYFVKLLVDQEYLRVSGDSPFAQICDYEKYMGEDQRRIDPKTRRLQSIEIVADEKNYKSLWLLLINSEGNLTSEIDSNVTDNYITYSDKELGEIIGRMKSRSILAESTEQVLDRFNYVNNNYNFVIKPESGVTYKYDAIRSENQIGNIYIKVKPNSREDRSMRAKRDISCSYDKITCDGICEGSIFKLISTPESKIEVSAADYKNIIDLSFGRGEQPVYPVVKFSDNEELVPILQMITTPDDPALGKFNIECINLRPAKEMTNTRDTLRQIIERVRKLKYDDISIDNFLYDRIFNENKDEILDVYFERLHRQLKYDIENIIKPIIDEWFNSDVFSGNAETMMLENIVHYGTVTTDSISESFTEIPRSVIDTISNVIYLICKCSKSVKYYKRDFGIVQYTDINTLELNRDTLDYDKITLQDLWGYNIAYDSSESVFVNRKQAKSGKYYLDGTDVTIKFKLSDKKIGDVINSLVRLIYGVYSLLGTIPTSNTKKDSSKGKNLFMNEDSTKGKSVVKVRESVAGIYNVNDDNNNTKNSVALFNWDEMLDWDNSLKGVPTRNKRQLFNVWMREYISYMERIVKPWYDKVLADNSMSDVNKDLYMTGIIVTIIKTVYDNRINGQVKPTVDEIFNLLFYVNSDLENESSNPEGSSVQTMYSLGVYDDFIANRVNYVGDVILYCNGIINTKRYTPEIIEKYAIVETSDFKATKSNDEDLNRFDSVCKLVLAYKGVSESIINRFMKKMSNLYDSVNDVFTFTKDDESNWLAEIGVYAPTKYIHKQVDFIRNFNPDLNDIMSQKTVNFSFKSNPTLSRDIYIISRLYDKKDFIDLVVKFLSEIPKNEINNTEQIDNKFLTVGLFYIQYDSKYNDRKAAMFRKSPKDISNINKENLVDFLYTTVNKYLVSGIAFKEAATNRKIFSNELIDYICRSFTVKTVTICHTKLEVLFMLSGFMSKIDSELKESDNDSIDSSIKRLDILSKDSILYDKNLMNTEVAEIRNVNMTYIYQLNNLTKFSEYVPSDVIDGIMDNYKTFKTELTESGKIKFINKSKLSSKAKKQANLSYRYFLETGDIDYYNMYVADKVNLVDEELLFENNWDGKFKIASPFSVRSVIKSVCNLNTQQIVLDKEEISKGINITYSSSDVFEYYIHSVLEDKFNPTGEGNYNGYAYQILLYKMENDVGVGNDVDVFAIYDAFAQAYIKNNKVLNNLTAQEAKKVYKNMYTKLSEKEVKLAEDWFDTCELILQVDTALQKELSGIDLYINENPGYEATSKINAYSIITTIMDAIGSSDTDLNTFDSSLLDVIRKIIKIIRCYSDNNGSINMNSPNVILQSDKEFAISFNNVKLFIDELKDLYLPLIQMSIEDTYTYVDYALSYKFRVLRENVYKASCNEYGSMKDKDMKKLRDEETELAYRGIDILEQYYIDFMSKLPDLIYSKMSYRQNIKYHTLEFKFRIRKSVTDISPVGENQDTGINKIDDGRFLFDYDTYVQ